MITPSPPDRIRQQSPRRPQTRSRPAGRQAARGTAPPAAAPGPDGGEGDGSTLRLLATLDTECASVDQLGQATAEAFAQHPDYQIITSFTGLGDTTGARVLAEIGDDRTRFADARALKAHAGSAPVTRASGRSLLIIRRVKNTRLAAADFVWAFVAATHSPGASALYYRRREHGDRHAAALRNLFNRLIGCLYHCLQTGQKYDETTAFPAQSAAPEPAAA